MALKHFWTSDRVERRLDCLTGRRCLDPRKGFQLTIKSFVDSFYFSLYHDDSLVQSTNTVGVVLFAGVPNDISIIINVIALLLKDESFVEFGQDAVRR